jgi:hypothetical protein
MVHRGGLPELQGLLRQVPLHATLLVGSSRSGLLLHCPRLLLLGNAQEHSLGVAQCLYRGPEQTQVDPQHY